MPQKVFFPDNIKFLRERKKFSQDELSNVLGITRSKLNALENGQTKSPQLEDLISFSEYFKVSMDSLVKVELKKLGELKLRELEAGNDVYMTGGKIRVLAITVDRRNKENIEFVPIKAKAGYLNGYNDPEFIATLPTYSFPGLAQDRTYRLFPISGESMLPIPDGAMILTSYVRDWTDIKPRTLAIVVLKNDQDFVFKMLTWQGKELLLESSNERFGPYQVAAEQVAEIWRFERYISDEPPAVSELSGLKHMIQELSAQVKVLADKKG